MAKPSPTSALPPRLLVLELWGLGDLVLAIPFLRGAGISHRVTLVAKPTAGPLLSRFAPDVELVSFTAPWTAFRGKYRLLQWPWRELRALRRALRDARFAAGVSARPDPRDHLLLALAGARTRLGFGCSGSALLLNRPLPRPPRPHRAEHWATLANALDIAPATPPPRPSAGDGRNLVIHTGAGHPVRLWPRERYEQLAAHLRVRGWRVTILDDTLRDLGTLVGHLASADRFVGNDSGPGHLAALLGVPTFTLFGPQLPELFAPRQAAAGWIEGAPCPHKPCFDRCRFSAAHCLADLSFEQVRSGVEAWLAQTEKAAKRTG